MTAVSPLSLFGSSGGGRVARGLGEDTIAERDRSDAFEEVAS